MTAANDNDAIADVILEAIDLERAFFVRFRDAWIDGEEICVRARLGGEGNRRHYAQVFALLRGHPHYIRDDDDVDTAYCTFYFATTAAQAAARRA